jgi:hypothetical protein
VGVWRSNSTHSLARQDPRDFGLTPRPLYTRGRNPIFIFIEYDDGCAPDGVWMLSRKYFASAGE